MLDYGVRSKCCFAPIKFGMKLNKKTGIKTRIMICVRCTKKDVDIVSRDDAEGQVMNRDSFADEFRL